MFPLVLIFLNFIFVRQLQIKNKILFRDMRYSVSMVADLRLQDRALTLLIPGASLQCSNHLYILDN